jgi:uncharacterized protein
VKTEEAAMFAPEEPEMLDLIECLRLFEKTPIGRIVFTDQCLPVVLPVTYAMDGESAVIRTTVETVLSAAERSSVVAFEIDGIEPDRPCGWTVTGIGQAELVTDPAEVERLSTLPMCGPTSAAARFVRIRLNVVQGRLLGQPVYA